jgi:hypothetical protein
MVVDNVLFISYSIINHGLKVGVSLEFGFRNTKFAIHLTLCIAKKMLLRTLSSSCLGKRIPQV